MLSVTPHLHSTNIYRIPTVSGCALGARVTVSKREENLTFGALELDNKDNKEFSKSCYNR